jgi:hypothetical protein
MNTDDASSDVVSHTATPRLEAYDTPNSDFEQTAAIIGTAGADNLVHGMPNTMTHSTHPMWFQDGKGENAFQYTSLQEMEQFTLPLAYQSSLAYASIPFLSAAVPPTRAFPGTPSLIAANSRYTT